ncbi:MAG: DUF6503 family protein [Bacteroidota bacterium]
MSKIMTIVCGLVLLIACREQNRGTDVAQEIVDQSIVVCGGERYRISNISFVFRQRTYALERQGNQKVLSREHNTDTALISDYLHIHGFKRFVNDSALVLPDSLANAYANALNSVHYFAYLPNGLNDPAVNKDYLGETHIDGSPYHKIRITFDQEGGGVDHEDVFLYWFNAKTLKPDYLAYRFHVDGGGIRFRKAYNERYVNGIRFVDYMNYEPLDLDMPLEEMDTLFSDGGLKLLSKIELREIRVSPGNYN